MDSKEVEMFFIVLTIFIVFGLPTYFALVLGIRDGLPQKEEKIIKNKSIREKTITTAYLVEKVDLRDKINLVLDSNIYDFWNLSNGSKESLGCYKLFYEYKIDGKIYRFTRVVTGLFDIPNEAQVYYNCKSPTNCVIEGFEACVKYPYSIAFIFLLFNILIFVFLYKVLVHNI